MKQKIALTISRILHPMVLMPLFIAYVVFSLFPGEQAIITTASIIGIGILPLALWNIYRTHTGKYSNFDVSVREQRFSMFVVVFLLSLILMGYLWISGQPDILLIGCGLVMGLIFTSFVLNFWLKISLHTAILTYISIGLWPMDYGLGISLAAGVPLVAWARVVQARHSLFEVGIGFLNGIIFGICLLLLTGYFD
jgi:hypothetical protein